MDYCTCSSNHNEIGIVSFVIKEQIEMKQNIEEKFMCFYCEREVYRNSMGGITGTSKICTVQISYVDNLSNVKYALLQVYNLISLHNQLLELLKVDNLKISGLSVGGYLVKIGRDFRCANVIKTLENITNLGRFSRKINVVPSGVVKLKTLAKSILKEDLYKDDNIRLSNW